MRARIPDLDKAYEKGRKAGISSAIESIVMLGVLYLADRRGWKHDSLLSFVNYLMRQGEAVNDGRLSLMDIRETLKTEYDIVVRFEK